LKITISARPAFFKPLISLDSHPVKKLKAAVVAVAVISMTAVEAYNQWHSELAPHTVLFPAV
jgi:hypothetical protein